MPPSEAATQPVSIDQTWSTPSPPSAAELQAHAERLEGRRHRLAMALVTASDDIVALQQRVARLEAEVAALEARTVRARVRRWASRRARR